MALLEVSGLQKSYGKNEVLRGASALLWRRETCLQS